MGKKAKKWKRRARMLQKNLQQAWHQAEDLQSELVRLRGECVGLRETVAVERDISAGLQRKLDCAMFSQGMYPPHLVPTLKGVFEDVVGIVDGLLPERAGEIIYDDPKTVPDLRPQMRRLRNEARRALLIIEQESKSEASK